MLISSYRPREAALCSLALGVLALGCTPEPSVRIDEVVFEAAADGPFGGVPWVEVHNPAERTVVELDALQIVDLAGDAIALPSIELPPGARLVVPLGPPGAGCVEDLDLADGRGLMCDGAALDLGDADAGAVGLADASGLVDFLAWGAPGTTEVPGPIFGAAVDEGLWPAGRVIPTRQSRPGQKIVRSGPGESIARRPGERDRDRPEDFALWGGPGLMKATPGTADDIPGVYLVPDRLAAPADPREWLVLWYGAADDSGDVQEGIVAQLHQMETAIAEHSPDAWFVAQIDSHNLLAERDPVTERDVAGTEGHTFRGELRGDRDPAAIYLHGLVGDQLGLGERATDDGAELRAFVDWALDRYPSRRVALIVSGHGRSWKGLAYDEQSGDREMAIGELGDALDGVRLDLLGFDACLMAGVEVAWEVRRSAAVMVASQSTEDGDGWPMEEITPLFGTGQDAEAVSRGIVRAYAAEYAGETGWTLSAARLGAPLEQLADAVDALARGLGADEFTRDADPYGGLDDHGDLYAVAGLAADDVQTSIGAILRDVRHFGSVVAGEGDLVDLYDLVERIEQALDIPRQYVTATSAVLLAHRATVFAEAHSADLPGSHGLSIYFPESQTGAARLPRPDLGEDAENEAFNDSTAVAYDGETRVKYGPDEDPVCGDERPDHPLPNAPNFDWVNDFEWHGMLHRFYEPVADAHCTPALVFQGGEVICTGVGSADWDGEVLGFTWDFDAAVNGDDGDWDRDCEDESDDDLDAAGSRVALSTEVPGRKAVVLTVTDDEFERMPTHYETDQDGAQVDVYPLILEFEPDGRPGAVLAGRVVVRNPFEVPIFGLMVEVSSDREQFVFEEIWTARGFDGDFALLRGERGENLGRDGARVFVEVLEPEGELVLELFGTHERAAIDQGFAEVRLRAESENVAAGEVMTRVPYGEAADEDWPADEQAADEQAADEQAADEQAAEQPGEPVEP